MPQETQRERSLSAEKVLLTSAVFATGDLAADRQAAVDWGEAAFVNDEVTEPFTPFAVGPLAVGHWPSNGLGQLLELNESKGNLPADADLEFGITLWSLTGFHGIKKVDEGFVAIVSGNVNYVAKATEPV